MNRLLLFVEMVCTCAALSAADTLAADKTIDAERPQRVDPSGLARHISAMARMPRGVCSILGCRDGRLAEAMASADEFVVHAIDPSAENVAAGRAYANRKGLYGKRIVIERGSLRRLPYADNSIDLVVAPYLSEVQLRSLCAGEILRVLRPEGRAVLGRAATIEPEEGFSADRLTQWLKTHEIDDAEVAEDAAGVWTVLTKPVPEGIDAWSHWEHLPDNNPVSTDAVVRAPYMTQFLGEPYYIAMPAITTAAGGRIFIAMGHIAHHRREEPWLNTLLARNGYNGTALWMRKLPDGYLAHRSAFVATKDTFYMIDPGEPGVILLDPATGEQIGRIDVQEAKGQWKWIALQDDILYALSGTKKDPAETTVVRSKRTHWSWGELSKGYYGKRVPWGFGDLVVAYDLQQGKPLWTHREPRPIDSRAMSLGGGRMFVYGPDSHFRCLDALTGDIVWTNDKKEPRELLEEPGRGLTSTPGFRTMCYALYTPEALCYEAQTRMNVLALDPENGKLLWHRQKTSNNPNMLYVDDQLLVGIGPEGRTLAVEPRTGKTIEDLGFTKRSCARLTATPDSFFCRGWPDGLTRYDRNTGKVLFNGAFRPSCNDGVIAANGLLYLGPWACDCNLTLMGRVAMCSAGDFPFDRQAQEPERLERDDDAPQVATPLSQTDADWPTYRADNARSGSTDVAIAEDVARIWRYEPDHGFEPTAPTAAGGLIFWGGSDGIVRAVDAATGRLKWKFLTAGPVRQPPTIWNGRAYFGSGDGYIYAVEAATGRRLWRFRAAPADRRIMVYGSLSSTWPVHSGVLVEDGVAYAAAGMVDYDGTYVYALDAVTGHIQWQNTTSGHLDRELRKGVSAQGILTTAGDRLWMAAGNIVSPAAYDLQTGKYQGNSPGDGSPQANRGEEIGSLLDQYILVGGRLRYSATGNTVNPGTFWGYPIEDRRPPHDPGLVTTGKVPPVWDTARMVSVAGPRTSPMSFNIPDVCRHLDGGDLQKPPPREWVADALSGKDTVALVLTPNAVLSVCEVPRFRSLYPRWALCALDPDDGSLLWQHDLPSNGSHGGLLVDRDGRIIIVDQEGGLVCYGGMKMLRASLNALIERTQDDPAARRESVERLRSLIGVVHGPDRQIIIKSLQRMGIDVSREARGRGYLTHWWLRGPFPWNSQDSPAERRFVGEPDVDPRAQSHAGDGKDWMPYRVHNADGHIDLDSIYGQLPDRAVYAYAEFVQPEARDVLLKLGTNDGFVLWVNGQQVGRFEGGRSFRPDQDVFRVRAVKGTNRVLVKILNLGARWAFTARVTDLENRPLVLDGGPADATSG